MMDIKINEITVPHERHVNQMWLVGQRVRVTKAKEPALKDVKEAYLTAIGTIVAAKMRFAGNPDLQMIVYNVHLESFLLSSRRWEIRPGYDTFKVELIDSGQEH